uniref:Protein kinase domain-containing protein n=1 Tax=Oryza glumipatula TaxID=40148 RepID=A0A0E0AZ94_9ORYZ
MVPKIADFGLSRLLGEGKSRTVTRNKPGTIGYMAPEYLDGGAITTKSDIYSLGVIIREMVIGRHKMGAPTGNALESWKTRLELDSSHTRQVPLEVGYQQVEACIEISRRCTDTNPDNRPATLEILHKLEETETVDATSSPVLAQIRSISRLMNDLKLMAVTFSRQSSTRVERYKVFSPVPSLSTPPTNKIIWVDSTSGANCYLLSSRSLRITWGDTPGHWRWISLPNSRFAECAELLDVHWLAITGEISPKDLTMDTPYVVYLVYNLASGTSGLRGVQTSSLRLYGERVVATSRVSVYPAVHSGTCDSDVAYPIGRDDGWMELKLAEFTNDHRMLAEAAVIVDFREVNVHIMKSGLIVEGLEFRPTIPSLQLAS